MKSGDKNLWQNIKRYSFAYYFILPTFLAMLFLHLSPIVQGIYMSFLNLNQFTLQQYLLAPFCGLDNYYKVLIDPNSPIRIGLFESVRNTFIYTVLVTIGTLVMGMVVALMVNRKFFGRPLVRTLFLLPWIVPTYVTGLLWGIIWLKEGGLANVLLCDWLHILPFKPSWLSGSNTLWAIVIPSIWRFWPLSMLMLLSGLQTIPDELYEAADIDGAGPWRKFWMITWPMLRPVWFILILFGLIYNTYSFNIVIMMFGFGAGYPGEWGDLMMTNIFRNSFQLWNFGTGAATSILLLIVMIIVVNVWFKYFKQTEEASR